MRKTPSRSSYNRRNRFNDLYTIRKEALLDAIRSYITACQRSPTLRELQTITGWGSPTLQGYLRRLEQDGLIRREVGKRRGIRIADS